MEGTLHKFDSNAGYGFITNTDGVDIFVHKAHFKYGDFKDGDYVTFSVGQGALGPQAENVEKVEA